MSENDIQRVIARVHERKQQWETGPLKKGLGTRAYALFERGGFLQTAQLLGQRVILREA